MIVSVIVTAHREGRYLSASMRSVRQALGTAGLDESNSEIILSLDRPDGLTREVAQQPLFDGVQVQEVDFGDPARSRNACIERAHGEWIALLDGDDVWGSHWLQRGLAHGQRLEDTILHAQIIVTFPDLHVWQSPDMHDPAFAYSRLLVDNCWTSLALARTGVFRRFPYVPLDDATSWGYEDWTWNCDTVAAGISHRIVPKTAHFVRKKRQSRNTVSADSGALTAPHRLSASRVLELQAAKGA